MQQDQQEKRSLELKFFSEYGDANRYRVEKIIGKGSYGVVCSAIDTHTGEMVAIKKMHNIFEHNSDAVRTLREIKLLRLLKHPDIVEIKHIMLPPSRRDFKDVYIVFELMESDLHQVIKANDDLTKEHIQFFIYQLLRALKYIHTANVYHRDLKPKNILANANCKLKICDFGLARVAFDNSPTTVLWTDYVATRWYRAPELCGSFFSKYTTAIDIWSVGCIFAELLIGKPLFPGKNVAHQLDLITALLGTPSFNTISQVQNEKARKYLRSMRKKEPIPFTQKFLNADPLALKLLEKLLSFDPKNRPTVEEALADPYFKTLAKVEREPSRRPIPKKEFDFEQRRLTKEDIQELIFHEILEYHPQLLESYIKGSERTKFLYPSALDQFRRQFTYLEENGEKNGPATLLDRKHVSLPRSTMVHSAVPLMEKAATSYSIDKRSIDEAHKKNSDKMECSSGQVASASNLSNRFSNAWKSFQGCRSISYSQHSHRNTRKLESSCVDTAQAEQESVQHQPTQTCLVSEVAALPFHFSGDKVEPADRNTATKSLFYARSHFNWIITADSAASDHRKIGSCLFGLSSIY
ncbi:mitogen-activated protein kinase 15-like [Zingiber officinale]|uniref:mitogen-activated protein kinase 15-like n=1 Tax=Zingiber officinale TaxID=94328 RepID=UPI001C4DB109|nr:mitogen-activated protein kinase 15-like [Zingiber officinale]